MTVQDENENTPSTAVSELTFLDEVRSIAQRGLMFARDNYDIERYERLMALTATRYEELASLPAGEVRQRFAQELGYPTAKVGVDTAIPDEAGKKLLLIRRADSKRWALPGGWIDPGQTPEQAVAREVFEETTMQVKVGRLLAVNTQLPSKRNGPHTSVHLLYSCTWTAGEPTITNEAVELGFFEPTTVLDWHQGHGIWATQALRTNAIVAGDEDASRRTQRSLSNATPARLGKLAMNETTTNEITRI